MCNAFGSELRQYTEYGRLLMRASQFPLKLQKADTAQKLRNAYNALPYASDALKLQTANTLSGVLNDPDHAISIFDTIDVSGYKQPGDHVLHAVLLARFNQPAEAEQRIDELYESDPPLADAHAKLGWEMSCRHQNHKEAARLFEKDIQQGRLTPRRPFEVHYATILLRNGSRAEAESQLQSCLAKHEVFDKGYANAVAFYALELARQREMSAAEELVARACQACPDLTDGYARLGWIVSNTQKNHTKAVEYFQRDLDTARITDEWYFNYALVLARDNNLDAAESIVADLYERYANFREGYTKLALQLARSKENYETVSAMKAVTLAYDESPELTGVYLSIAWQRLLDGNQEAALRLFRQEVSRGRVPIAPSGQAAVLFFLVGDVGKARAALGEKMELGEVVRFAKMLVHVQTLRIADVPSLELPIKLLSGLVATDERHEGAAEALMRCHYFNGDFEAAYAELCHWEREGSHSSIRLRVTLARDLALDDKISKAEVLLRGVDVQRLQDPVFLYKYIVAATLSLPVDPVRLALDSLYALDPDCLLSHPDWCTMLSLTAYRLGQEELSQELLAMGRRHSLAHVGLQAWLEARREKLAVVAGEFPPFRIAAR